MQNKIFVCSRVWFTVNVSTPKCTGDWNQNAKFQLIQLPQLRSFQSGLNVVLSSCQSSGYLYSFPYTCTPERQIYTYTCSLSPAHMNTGINTRWLSVRVNQEFSPNVSKHEKPRMTTPSHLALCQCEDQPVFHHIKHKSRLPFFTTCYI